MKLIFLIAFLMISRTVSSQEVIPLYPGKIPNSKPGANNERSETSDGILIISKVSEPSLTIFLPPKEKSTGTAVIICPGGGYWIIAAGHEGNDVAKKFNEEGVAAFVLKYRIPNNETMVEKEIGPLQDAQRAIQLVRQNARKWKIRKNKIGIMGFSAGGHLASTAGTHFEKSYIDNKKHISLRPDFMILIYPVISFSDSIGHLGSRDQLIGKNASADKINEYSNELHVTANTPPAFLVHSKNDSGVSWKNSMSFLHALQQKNVPAEIYLYENGGHGFGMNNPTSNVKWMDKVLLWMERNGWLKK
jgi:acetyl esterase/lipase